MAHSHRPLLTPLRSLRSPLQWYTHAHNKEMPIKSIARLIQTMLYARRMFPYYVYNVLAGIEEDDGTGAVYSFDPVGSYERETCRAAGAAQSLLQPFLDNQVRFFRSGSIPVREVVAETSMCLCAPLSDLLP